MDRKILGKQLPKPKYVQMRQLGINPFRLIKKLASLELEQEEIDKILKLYFTEEEIQELSISDIMKVIEIFAEDLNEGFNAKKK